ncbi:hypothetical protein LSH36_23g04011 [Paralvinella palmiformis]|uniref:G-protein coupled receptors family 1 profile domain-containing protein n=1 Tax=Paralvinella palmiformis TaxID=53620 RepID=A0AAD9KBX4_9ANNE|nr:hypothetical protein LSH36_23g04011 [Paralvinella palmiformis]
MSLLAASFMWFGNSFHSLGADARTDLSPYTAVSNMFIVSLAIADMIVGLIVMPISAIYIFTLDWLFGVAVCQFWISVDYTASTASILNLFILSLDRYWSVSSPLRYIRQRTKRRALIMISMVWFVSSLWLIPIIGWHYFEYNGIRTVPDDVCDTEYATNTALKIITGLLNFYLPITIMYGLYGTIFLEIKRRSKLELGQQVGGATMENSCAFCSEDSDDKRYADSIPLQNSHLDAVQRNGKCAASGEMKPAYRRDTDPDTDTDQTEEEFVRKRASGYANMKLVRVSMGKLSPLEIYPDTPDFSSAQYLYDPPDSKRVQQDPCDEYSQSGDDLQRDTGDDDTTRGVESPAENGPCDHQPTNGNTRVRFHLDQERYDKTSVPLPKETHPAKNTYVVKPHYYLSTKLSSESDDDVNASRHKLTRSSPTSNRIRTTGRQRRDEPSGKSPPRTGLARTGRRCDRHASLYGGRQKELVVQNSALIRQAVRWRHRIDKRRTRPSSALSREIKAARQLGVIMGAFTLCFLPYFICFMVVAFCENCVAPSLMTTVTWIGYLNSTLNPFIYPMCNVNFRRKFREMLHLSHRQNDSHRNSVCYSHSRHPSTPIVHET